MPSTILLTGATGFVGRTTVPRLATDGYEVRALVRDPSVRVHGVSPVVGTLEGVADWAPSLVGVDTVVHLAARVHVMHERAADPLAAFRALNRDATLALAEAAIRAGVRRFVYLSSIKVNGEGTTTAPFRASDPVAPLDPYARSKWEAEQGLAELAARSGLEVVVIRPPLVHGPGAGGNLRRLLALVARGIPLPFAAIRNSRRMVGVRNLADLIATAVRHPSAHGTPLLAGDGESLSTPDLIRMLGVGLGRSARLFSVPVALLRLGGRLAGRQDEIDRLVGSLEVDIGDTSARLGWEPRVSVEEGLAEMARAWKESR